MAPGADKKMIGEEFDLTEEDECKFIKFYCYPSLTNVKEIITGEGGAHVQSLVLIRR